MSSSPEVEVYQLRVFLRQISPMIWRRLLVRSDSTIADLHYTLQIAMGWDDFHLHQFIIRGKYYGVSYESGPLFSDDAEDIRLSDFQFRRYERFLYEYDFGDLWQHEIRMEETLPLDPKKTYPVCIAGKRTAPPEDCGGPWAFMALSNHFNIIYIADRLQEIMEMEAEDRDYCYEEVHEFMYWLKAHKFDRRTVNKHLKWYAIGDERWREWPT
jgi:hypothetical protein